MSMSFRVVLGVGVGVGLIAGAASGCNRPSTAGGRSAPPCRDEPFSNEVCIAEGSFSMGHPTIPSTVPGESPFAPVHTVTLPSFFIDVDPVTNGEYRACFDAGVCPDECQRHTAAPARDLSRRATASWTRSW